AEQDILKAKSDAAVQKAQDDVALLKARFDVRQAELEMQKNELVSSIDARKNQLALDQAKRALDELEQNIKSHTTTGQTGIDLANINVGQPAEMEFDALPGRTFHGVVKSAGGMVQRAFWETDSLSKFDVAIQLTDADPSLRPGLTAEIVVLGSKNANTLYVPR